LRYLVFLVLFCISWIGYAQDYLVLEKMGTKKRYEYFPNDKITIQVTGEDSFRKEEIVNLTDSSIVFASGVVLLKNIYRVKPPITGWMVATGGTLVVAGVGYYIIDTFNQVIVAGNKYSTDDGVLRTSIILTGIGASLILLSSKKVKLNKNWRVRIVDIY
jgi:hypothetical protein